MNEWINIMIFYKQLKYVFLIIFMIAQFNGCINIDRPPICRKNIWYGLTEQNFRFHFWNYYQRGMSFEDGGILAYMENDYRMARQLLMSALLDFQEALSKRKLSGFDIFTYGDHTIDYFPYQELGIVNYYLARIDHMEKNNSQSEVNVRKAIEHLESSIYGHPLLPGYSSSNNGINTEKARKYLKMARSFFFTEIKHQAVPDFFVSAIGEKPTIHRHNRPLEILIDSLSDNHLTYLNKMVIEGEISGHSCIEQMDIFVKDHADIIQKRLSVQITEKANRLFFSALFNLKPGKTIISIHAHDRSQNQGVKTIQITQKKMNFMCNHSRFCVLIEPFHKAFARSMDQETAIVKWTNNFESRLECQMKQYPRFMARSKLNLKEHSKESDCHLFGNIIEWGNGIEINARLILAKKTKIIARASVFYPFESQSQMDSVLDRLAQSINVNMANQWPLLTGKVLNRYGKNIQIRFDWHDQAEQFMEGIIYPKETTESQMFHHNATEIERFALHEPVQKHMAFGRMNNKNRSVCKGMIVMTR
jgi:hypothetical protein